MLSRIKFDRSQYPYDAKGLVAIVSQSRDNSLRIKYTGGKFPVNAENAEVMINLKSFKRLLSYDPLKNTITVEPGITLKELVSRMSYISYTLDMYGIIPDMTVADAINVGLIGSNSSISHTLTSCTVVLPNTTVAECSWPTLEEIPDHKSRIRKDEHFSPSLQTLVCGLGTVGVITKCTLKCVPDKYAQENISQMPMEDFVEDMGKLSDAMFVNVHWFPLVDRVMLTRATSVRLRLAEFQPPWKKYLESFCWGLHWLVKSVSPSLSWYFPGHSAFLSYSQFSFMRLASVLRTTYSYRPQTFVSVASHCRGIKWAFPLSSFDDVVKSVEKWCRTAPHLCTTPVSISLQQHHGFAVRRPFLCPYSERLTFTLWCDWFNSATIHTEFCEPMAELESRLQKCGGRKCWSAGPVYASPLIGKMYPGYRHWCETRTILDPKTLFRSAYVEGDLIGE